MAKKGKKLCKWKEDRLTEKLDEFMDIIRKPKFLCKKCGRPTCGICFGVGAFRRILQSKLPEARICRICAKAEEQKTSGSK